ncbi:MAG: tetrahydromethanopterin S-methyltransferase subunit A [Candidatus Thorarchaeota archaeon]|nr:MAG: tetrahydromethanopterin S-methyltransferase subunit A [Candidatus Thorarchaeota archaeon]
MSDEEQEWPPMSGDFEVGSYSSCVAICTLGKKISIKGDFALNGSCKTENIGIERVVANIVANPNIRFLILAGPEVPGHLTGKSFKCLHENGIDEETRRIIDAPGAIPYIENIPVEVVERFRVQIELIDFIRVLDADAISAAAAELVVRNPGPFPDDPIWIEFKAKSAKPKGVVVSAEIMLLPEYGMSMTSSTSLISKQESIALIATHPSNIGAKVTDTETGTITIGKEL